MAKISERPVESSEAVRQEEARRQESTPNIKWRVIASYVLLTLLSGYTIYDYRIRPDCICRPRPYVFAISAFAISGLYGIIGVLNRVFPEQRWTFVMTEGMEVLLFSVFLPYVAAEIWTMNKIFPKYRFLPSIVGSIGYPAVDFYYFFHKPLELYTEGAMVLQILVLFFLMAFMAGIKYFAVTALSIYAAYFTKRRFQKMPFPECWMSKTETINYALSTSVLCASISMV